MADEDYTAVLTPEEEEEERKRQYGGYAPARAYDVGAEPALPAAAATSARGEVPVSPNGAPGDKSAIPRDDYTAAMVQPVAPSLSPAQTRLKILTDQGAPPVKPLHGFRKFLDVAAQFTKPTQIVDQALRYGPQRDYARNLAQAQSDVTAETAGAEAPSKEQNAALAPVKTQAEIDEAKARTHAIENPPEKTPQEPGAAVLHDLMTGDNGKPRINPQTGQPYSYLEAYQESLKAKATAEAGAKANPLAKDKAQQLNNIWDPILSKHNLPTGQFKEGMTDADAKELAQNFNNALGKQQGDTHITIAQTAAEDKKNKPDKDIEKRVHDQFDKTLDADTRLSRMEASYKKATGEHPDQQAMLSLLTDHIGMTLGLQKGARITKDILHEAQQSQPWLESIAAKFDDRGYLSGVTLGPEQMKQMLDLGYEARNRQWEEANHAAELYGVAPPPGAKTIQAKRNPDERIYNKPFAVPEGAPEAPKEDGHKLKSNGQVIAVSKGGKWVAPQ